MKKKYSIPIVIMLAIYFALEFVIRFYRIDFDDLPYIYRCISVLILFLPIIILFTLLGCDKAKKIGVRVFAFAVVVFIVICFIAAAIVEYMEGLMVL